MRKYETEDGRPVEWVEDVIYVRNQDGSISIIQPDEEGDPDDADH